MTAHSTVTNPTPDTRANMNQEDADQAPASWFQRNRNFLVFSGLAALYLLPFMTFFQTALLECDAVSLLHGAVFPRDFWEVMGPGTFYWNAAFMKVFGADFFGARVCLYFTSLGSGIAIYYLAQHICSRYRWLPAVTFVAAYFGGKWPLMSHHTDSNFFALLAVVCVVLWYDGRHNLWLWGAGLLAAVTSYTLQPKGLFLYFAILVWLFVLYTRKQIVLRPIITLTASYAVSMSVPLLYFWSQRALWDLIYANLIWPATQYSSLNDVPYGFGTMKYWREFSHPVHGSYVLAVFAPVLTAPYFFIDALPFLLAMLVVLRWRDAIHPKVLLLLLCGGAIWLSEFHRKELGHLACGSVLLLVVFCYFLLEYRTRIAKIALQLLAVCSVSLATFNLMMMAGTHPLHTRVGTVRVYKPFPVVKYLEEHAHPGEYIFCFQYCPSYYFLDQTPDATRYTLLMYSYNTQHQFENAIAEIQQRQVKYVVWQGGAALKDLYYILPGSDKKPPYGFVMDDYLHSHYREVKSFADGMQIWERDGDD